MKVDEDDGRSVVVSVETGNGSIKPLQRELALFA
jgi:hypothetical protein